MERAIPGEDALWTNYELRDDGHWYIAAIDDRVGPFLELDNPQAVVDKRLNDPNRPMGMYVIPEEKRAEIGAALGGWCQAYATPTRTYLVHRDTGEKRYLLMEWEFIDARHIHVHFWPECHKTDELANPWISESGGVPRGPMDSPRSQVWSDVVMWQVETKSGLPEAGGRSCTTPAQEGTTQPMSVVMEERPATEPDSPWMTQEEMAKHLKWSRSTLQRRDKVKGFPVDRKGKMVRYNWREVDDFITRAAKEGRNLWSEVPQRKRKT
jgi:hypothetical protein